MTLTSSNLVAWHDRTPDQHGALVATWAGKQFRTLSLSLYGTTSAPLYAAVMVKRQKVIASKQVGPVDAAGMQAAFDERAEQGWGPYLITATGPANAPLFAAVFTPMPAIPLTRLSLTKERFVELNGEQQAAGRILLWADAFGSPDDVRYTAIWGPNPGRVAWSCDAVDEGGPQLQNRFDQLCATGNRPALIAVTPGGRHLEMFVDSRIGPWTSVAEVDSAGYQKAFDDNAAQGRYPLVVSASGAGSGARFAAIFATRERTDERVFRATGPVTVAAIDTAMESYVRDHNLRGAALAVTRGSRLVYARGYTNAEPAPVYADVQPTTPFRQASVSKAFAAVALWRLIQDRSDVSLDTTLQSVLSLTQPDGSAPKDKRFADITLRHLLESNSGIDQGAIWWSKDAVDAFGTQLPATHLQIARHATSFDLTAAPGSATNVVYGNTDYFFIGLVVAALAGTATFEQALSTLVLAPLGMTRTRGSISDVGSQLPDEARHHMSVYNPDSKWKLFPMQLVPSVKHADQRLVAAQYGGWDYELFDGCGGLSSAVVDVARLAAMFSARSGNPVLKPETIDDLLQHVADATSKLSGPDAHGYHGFDWATAGDVATSTFTTSKGGWLPSQSSVVTFTTGGFGYVIARNGNGAAGVSTTWLPEVQQAVEKHTWSDDDLFPAFGMPTLASGAITVTALPEKVKAAVLSNLSVQQVESSMTAQAAAAARRVREVRPVRGLRRR